MEHATSLTCRSLVENLAYAAHASKLARAVRASKEAASSHSYIASNNPEPPEMLAYCEWTVALRSIVSWSSSFPSALPVVLVHHGIHAVLTSAWSRLWICRMRMLHFPNEDGER